MLLLSVLVTVKGKRPTCAFPCRWNGQTLRRFAVERRCNSDRAVKDGRVLPVDGVNSILEFCRGNDRVAAIMVMAGSALSERR